MANTIGKLVGKIEHTFSTKLDNGDKCTVKLAFDFTTASDDEIASWLVSNRVIAFQRPARSLTASELKKLDGTTVIASDVGKKIASELEKFRAGIAALRAMGKNEIANELEHEWNEKHNN